MAVISRENLLKRMLREVVPTAVSQTIGCYRYRKRVDNLKKKGCFDKRFPEALNLSLSALCNTRCIYCPDGRGKGITPPFMPFELAKKIIDEAKTESFEGTFRFGENGEALLNKEFLKIYEYERKVLPLSKSVLYTNMSLLDKETGLKLLTYGLDELNFNIDGASEVTYQAAKRLNLETLKKNLHNFIENRKKTAGPCRIHIYILTAKKYMEKVEKTHISLPDDTEKVIEYWEPFLEKNDYISIVDHPYKWVIRERSRIPKTNPCGKFPKVLRECLIGPNGDIYLCCLDYLQKCVIGNVTDTSIKKIWNSYRRQTILKLLEMGRFDTIGEPCKFCLD
jgi:radical SAM protein with 4Fe4S-binding SPASM domain